MDTETTGSPYNINGAEEKPKLKEKDRKEPIEVRDKRVDLGALTAQYFTKKKFKMGKFRDPWYDPFNRVSVTNGSGTQSEDAKEKTPEKPELKTKPNLAELTDKWFSMKKSKMGKFRDPWYDPFNRVSVTNGSGTQSEDAKKKTPEKPELKTKPNLAELTDKWFSMKKSKRQKKFIATYEDPYHRADVKCYADEKKTPKQPSSKKELSTRELSEKFFNIKERKMPDFNPYRIRYEPKKESKAEETKASA